MTSRISVTDMPAEAFLDPSNFTTGRDGDAGRANKRYLDGLAECRDYAKVFIAINNTVSARLKPCAGRNGLSGSMNGYEKLGYHAYSADYLRAILDSGCPVWVYRVGSDGKVVLTDLRALQAAL